MTPTNPHSPVIPSSPPSDDLGDDYGFATGHADGSLTCSNEAPCSHPAKCMIERRCRKVSYGEDCRDPSSPASEERVGRFGHHPDPANDFCIEIEAIEGLAYDVGIGLVGSDPVELDRRIANAMEFRVGGDQIAILAKQRLRRIEGARLAGRMKANDDSSKTKSRPFQPAPQGHGAAPMSSSDRSSPSSGAGTAGTKSGSDAPPAAGAAAPERVVRLNAVYPALASLSDTVLNALIRDRVAALAEAVAERFGRTVRRNAEISHGA